MSAPTTDAGRTAGPWEVEDPMGSDIGLWIVEAGKQTYEWRCIALVCRDDPTNDEDRDPLRPITETEQRANAAFIVRACNSHDNLVKALEAACLYKGDFDPKTRALVEQVLSVATKSGAT